MAALLLLTPLHAQNQKIGFVSSSKILAEMPEAQEAQKKMEGMQKQILDEIEKRQSDIKAKLDEYEKKKAMLNDASKKAAEDEIIDMQRKGEAYRQEKSSELQKEQERLLEPVKDKVLKAIERVAKDEKYTFVFDKTEQINILLYGDAAHDLTFKIIDKLKRGK